MRIDFKNNSDIITGMVAREFTDNGKRFFLVDGEDGRAYCISPFDVVKIYELDFGIVHAAGDFDMEMEEELKGPFFKIEDYQDQKYLTHSSSNGNIRWSDNFDRGCLFNEDTAKLNMTILENAIGKGFLKLIEVDKNGKRIDE